MGKHEEITPNPNLYPEELQLKLYQAFIFSIPILFSIILFLLFYLFYLKRRANSMASQPSRLQNSTANNSVSFISTPWNFGIKGLELKDKLQVVQFDEELKARDILCCVCLGEFEMNEELRQLPLCKHLFHGDCIRHWLRTNATCPLCRCPVISAIKMSHPMSLVHNPAYRGGHDSPVQVQQREPGNAEPIGLEHNPAHQESHDSPNQAQQRDQGSAGSSSDVQNVARSDEHVIQINEVPSSSSSNSS